MNRRTLITGGILAVLLLSCSIWLYGQSTSKMPPPADRQRLPAPSQNEPKRPLSYAKPSNTPAAVTTTPTIGTPSATPNLLMVNIPVTVTVTVVITDDRLIAGSVNLLKLTGTGIQPTILGAMHDDGKNGDTVANDRMFSLQTAFKEGLPGGIQLQVSAAFSGQLRRITSTIVLPIWNSATVGASAGHFTAVFPPSWTIDMLPDLPAFPGASGAVISRDDDDIGDNGFTLISAPGTLNNLVTDLNSRFTLISDATVSSSGIPWRILVHGESESGLRFITAVTENNGFTFSIAGKYTSANAALIQTMISSFHF